MDKLDYLAMLLTDSHRAIEYRPKFWEGTAFRFKALFLLHKLLSCFGYYICTKVDIQAGRYTGKDHPTYAETMVGLKRLEDIKGTLRAVQFLDIPGDFVECGVWRGGASIFAKACIDEFKADRKVYVCDSFEGLPKPTLEQDAGDELWKLGELAVSLEEVIANFRKYEVSTDNVIFVKGWFKDTLPNLNVQQISVLRLDGDMYESTMDILNALFDKVVPGGFVIIDDYNSVKGCQVAVHEFLNGRGLSPAFIEIDQDAVYFRK